MGSATGYVVAQFHAREAPLQQVDGAGHGREVDALGGGAALDVVDVAAQRVDEEPLKGPSRLARASTQACTTALSVEPLDVRAR